MDRVLTEQEPTAAAKSDLGAKIRTAWELSKPPDYGALEDPLGEVVTGRMAIVARAQEGLASLFFFATFASVLAEVLLRLFGHPVIWALELPTYFFIWAFCVAAGLSDWDDHHLAFDLVAEKLPPRLKEWVDLLLNVLFVAIFAATVPGTLSFLSFSASQPSSGLPISQEWGYAGIFLLFVVAVLLRARLIVLQIVRVLRRPRTTLVSEGA